MHRLPFAVLLLVACRVSAPTPPGEPAEAPLPPTGEPAAASAPGTPAATVDLAAVQPALHGAYELVGEDPPDSPLPKGFIAERTFFEFQGPVAVYRYELVEEPVGDEVESRTVVCRVAARAEITWLDGAFEVRAGAGAEAEAIDLVRQEPKQHGPSNRVGPEGQRETRFDVHWTKTSRTCEVYFTPGVYRIEDVSTAATLGRPQTLSLVRGDKRYQLVAYTEDETPIKRAVSGHFGREIAD